MSDFETKVAAYLKFGSKLGFERMDGLLARLGDPQKDLPVIHVAGTNGKGSVCKYLYETLRAAGYSVGLFISPYIECFNERIQMDGAFISDEDLDVYGDKVLAAAASMTEEGLEAPTEFEVVTALGFVYFAAKKPDVVILEVGLGGVGDSTNVVQSPLATVITSISYDHMDRLGNTLAEIAANKAGIIKPGSPMILNVDTEEAREVIYRTAMEKEAPIVDVSGIEARNVRYVDGAMTFDVSVLGKDLPGLTLGMVGEHQWRNAVTAAAAIEILTSQGIIKVGEHALREGLLKARQPCRFEVLKGKGPSGKVTCVLDGAHNEAAMAVLEDTLLKVFPGETPVTVMGLLADKAYGPILEHVKGFAKDILTVTVPNPRTMTAEQLAEKIREAGIGPVRTEDSIEKAVEDGLALAEEKGTFLLITGSFYMVSEARKILKER